MLCEAHDTEWILCASHAVFKPDSGLRRNDEPKDPGNHQLANATNRIATEFMQ